MKPNFTVERFKSLINMLIGMLKDKHPQHFFYLDNASCIELKSVNELASGFLCTGEFHLEKTNTPQQLFTLTGPKDCSVKVLIEGSQLIYCVSKTGLVRYRIRLKEYEWHSFIIAHIEKHVLLFIDNDLVYEKVPTIEGIAYGHIGSMNGEIVRMCFYKPTKNIKALVKRIGSGKSKSNIIDDIEKQAMVLRIDPSIDLLKEKLNKVKVFYNRPAEDVLGNLGGFRTCFLLISYRLFYNPPASHFA